MWTTLSAIIYLFKVNNRNTKKRCEICSKLIILCEICFKVIDIVLVSLLLTVHIFHTFSGTSIVALSIIWFVGFLSVEILLNSLGTNRLKVTYPSLKKKYTFPLYYIYMKKMTFKHNEEFIIKLHIMQNLAYFH